MDVNNNSVKNGCEEEIYLYMIMILIICMMNELIELIFFS